MMALMQEKRFKGKGYRLTNPGLVARVDALYPHAVVDSDGNWIAEANPDFTPIEPHVPRTVAFAFSADANYYPGLITAISSVREHHLDTPIVVIDNGLTEMQSAYLSQFAEVMQGSRRLHHDPVWGKLDISLLDFERIVYLDADVILLRPVPELLHTDAEFAAVRNLDWTITENFTDSSTPQRYGVDPNATAFNSGVFSIDIRVWGGGRLLERAAKLYFETGQSFLYGDQSVLQIIMNSPEHRVTFLGDELNVIAECWDWENETRTPKIVHYAGNQYKPWHPLCSQPKLEYFFERSKIRK